MKKIIFKEKEIEILGLDSPFVLAIKVEDLPNFLALYKAEKSTVKVDLDGDVKSLEDMVFNGASVDLESSTAKLSFSKRNEMELLKERIKLLENGLLEIAEMLGGEN